MEKVIARLRRLRGWFVAGYVMQAAVGTWVAIRVLEDMRCTLAFREALRAADAGLVAASGLAGTLGILALLLWVFRALLRLREWARLVLLVLGWLSVAGAASSLVGTSSLSGLAHWAPDLACGLDLRGLASVSVVTNLLSLVLWGYVIGVLQFDHDVRDAFPAAAGGA